MSVTLWDGERLRASVDAPKGERLRASVDVPT